jgi:hypothetical protein
VASEADAAAARVETAPEGAAAQVDAPDTTLPAAGRSAAVVA